MRSRRRAFTLVELLVVIGIITLLVALAMPALGKVRKHAWEVNCAANLRSVGQAMAMYTQQYGYYPGCCSSGTGGAFAAAWPTRLRPFLGGDRRVFNCPAQDPRFQWTAAGPGGTSLGFASQTDAAWFGYDVGEPLITPSGSYFTYGYNMWGVGNGNPFRTTRDPVDHIVRGLGAYISASGGRRPGGNQIPQAEIPAGRVRRPSEMIAVADSTVDGIWDFAIDGSDGLLGEPPYGWPGAVHRGGANVLFCDGHVTWHVQSDLAALGGTASASARRRRMWHNDNLP
jgi:prepilin-type processing-associated H-X9-DG protein/prepilin-type N-terminal cleavage/methylation domain-containing protein